MNPGRNVVNLNWDAINADSVVMVSASEYTANSQQLPDGSDQRFIGAADVTVANVTPHGPPFDPNHGVTFVVEVGWSAPLTICTDIAVIQNAPDAVVFSGPQTQSRQMGTQTRMNVAPMARTSIEARVEPERVLSATIETSGANERTAPAMGSSRTSRVTRHDARVPTGSRR